VGRRTARACLRHGLRTAQRAQRPTVHLSRPGYESTECIIVLEGGVVEIGEERHVVVAGEALTFDPRLPHRFRDERLEQAVFVFAATPAMP
jgi:mannose-6-phosphate isomerase-like protein (cupin superfamily)